MAHRTREVMGIGNRANIAFLLPSLDCYPGSLIRAGTERGVIKPGDLLYRHLGELDTLAQARILMNALVTGRLAIVILRIRRIAQVRPVDLVGLRPLVFKFLEVLFRAEPRGFRSQRVELRLGLDVVVEHPLCVFGLADDALTDNLAADPDFLTDHRHNREHAPGPFLRLLKYVANGDDRAINLMAVTHFN